MATNFPASPEVATIGSDITNSANPTCTETEKTSLKEQKAAVEKAAVAVEEEFEEVQATLQGNFNRHEPAVTAWKMFKTTPNSRKVDERAQQTTSLLLFIDELDP